MFKITYVLPQWWFTLGRAGLNKGNFPMEGGEANTSYRLIEHILTELVYARHCAR
jgi:hypothetical protein